MKKIIILMLGVCLLCSTGGFATVNSIKSLDSTLKKVLPDQKVVNSAATTIYNDSKDVVKYGTNVLEKGVVRLDTILTKGFKQFSKGASHTFDVLKTQQLVKSLHHLFYWIVAIIIVFLLFKQLKAVTTKFTDMGMSILIGFIVIDIALFVYNGQNFMEMWTGFINPEYGVYLDIIDFMKSYRGEGGS